ncbi:MAG: hypothetical protein QGH25_07650 [Candidatus Latescibacteria bacterium]|jgi:hypothetical protein|nr:hypothetical protein [Candidatus Latescibacterota bacterium]
MLVSTATTGGVFGAPLKARHQRRTPAQGMRVKDGLGISPLRATGGPPSINQAAPRRSASLTRPPQSSGGVLFQLQGSVRSTSPLTAGVRTSHRSQTRSLGVLQARQSSLLGSFRKIDRGSRLLQANANIFRQQGAFSPKLGTSTLSLLG